MITLTAVFIAGFLSCLALCWIAYTFYTSFWQHFHHQKKVKNEEIIQELIEEIEEEVEVYEELEKEEVEVSEQIEKEEVEVSEQIDKEEVQVYEEKEAEAEDTHSKLSKILELLDRMNEEHRQQELALKLWRRFKNRFYTDSAKKELTGEYSEEEDSNIQFWYDQYILLEDYLFGKRDQNRDKDFDDLDEGDLD